MSDDSSHQNHKKRFYHQDSSMENKDRAPNKKIQCGGHTFERSRCPTYGKQHGVGVLQELIGVFHVVIRSTI